MNKSIAISFHIPSVLQHYMEKAERIYETKGDCNSDWYCALDDIEGLAKQANLAGSITREQLFTIFQRYGI